MKFVIFSIFLNGQFFMSRISKPKKKAKRKVSSKLAIVPEPETVVTESDLDNEPEDDDMHYDLDYDPVLETELEISEVLVLKQEPEAEAEQEQEQEPTTELIEESKPKSALPSSPRTIIQKKSGYQRKRTFECYQCSLPCSKLYELKAHITVFHPFVEEKKDVLNCPYCTKTTISRKVLSCHLRKVSFFCHQILSMVVPPRLLKYYKRVCANCKKIRPKRT